MRGLLLILLLLAAPLRAEEVVLGLSRDQVSISTNFDGSEVIIYGAIKREVPIPEGEPLQVIVTISGPQAPITVRRKDRVLGIWVNTDAMDVSAAPSFYAISTSAPWEDVLNEADDLRHTISIPRRIRSIG
ncbi:MAG: TIGR02186 family protein, partial [Marivita sp.]